MFFLTIYFIYSNRDNFTYNEERDGTITLTGVESDSFSITIPKVIDGKYVKRLGDNLFNSSSIEKIEILADIVSIGAFCFKDCESLTFVNITTNFSLIDIGKGAFFNCNMLKYFILTNTFVSRIGSFSFSRTDLSTFNYSKHLKEVGVNAFERSSIVSIDLSESNVTVLNSYVFYKCYSLTSVSFPNSLRYIDSFCFYESSLRNAELGGTNVLRIGDSAFSYCEKLDSITFPICIETLGVKAFHNCKSLIAVNLSSTNVSQIHDECFLGCERLSHILLGAYVNYFGNYSFSGTIIENLEFPNEFSFLGEGICSLCENLLSVDISGFKGNYIPDYSFFKCYSLIKVSLPDFYEKIGIYAFSYTSLDNLEFPASLKEISNYSFFGNERLSNINFLNTKIISLGYSCFRNCHLLSKVTLPPTLKTIYDHCFAETSITSVSFPYSVEYIGFSTFYNCQKLEYVNMSGSNIEAIGDDVFFNCTSLRNITLPENLSILGDRCFAFTDIEVFYPKCNLVTTPRYNMQDVFHGCQNLISINLSLTSIETLGSGCFALASKLAQIHLPQTLKIIESNCFFGTSITDICLPNISRIGSNAFFYCTYLMKLDMSQTSIEYIRDPLFTGCSSLRMVILPLTLNDISNKTFSSCLSIKNVYYFGSARINTSLSNIVIDIKNESDLLTIKEAYNECC